MLYNIKIPKDLDLDQLKSNRNKSPAQISPKNSNPLNSYRNNRNSLINNQLDFDKPSTPYEDRVIPALRNNFNKSRTDGNNQNNSYNLQNEDEQIENGGGVGVGAINEAIVPDQNESIEQEIYDPMDGTEEMSEREVREAALMNDVLGKQIVTKLYSKNFQNREDAIQEVYNNLNNYKGDKEEAKSYMRATAILVAKMCKDNVFSVFNNSIRLFHFLLDDFAKRNSIGKQEINYVLEKALPVLIHRTGDTNSRLRQRAHEYIVEMAMFPEIRPLHTVPNYCTIPIKLHIAPRLALSRVEIIEDLIKRLGTKDNGLNIDNISKFCAQALEHTSGEVRELATKILIQMYRVSFDIHLEFLIDKDNTLILKRKTVIQFENICHQTTK